jgi:hypothetical protein
MQYAVRMVGAPQDNREALIVLARENAAAAGDGSVRRSLCVGDPECMTHELTEERIAEAMARTPANNSNAR